MAACTALTFTVGIHALENQDVFEIFNYRIVYQRPRFTSKR